MSVNTPACEDPNMTPRGELLKPSIRSVEDFPNVWTYYRSKTVVVPPHDEESHHRMAIVEASGVLDFWDDPEEDIYTDDDAENP